MTTTTSTATGMALPARTDAGRRAPERLFRRAAVLLMVAALAGCGSSVATTPEKLDGTESHEFEQEDLDAAAGASDVVKAYCADAVSEAQRLGCESHAMDEDVP
jgi:predicted small lipoprotein YifL